VFGHGGAGVIEAVGSDVPNVAVGDHVIISFPWCGRCPNCRRQMPSHCLDSAKLKTSGMRPDGSMLMAKGDEPIYSAFFQQSSFATHAIANARLRREDQARCAPRPVGPVRLEHPNWCWRGAKCDATQTGRQLRRVRRRRRRPLRSDGSETLGLRSDRRSLTFMIIG
jgi:hypothetical protein